MIRKVQTSFDAVFDATLGKLWITRVWDNIARQMSGTRKMLTRHDVLLALALGLIGVVVSILGFAQTNRVPEIHTTFDLWFDADIARVAENLVSTKGDHGRTSVHPILSIVTYPIGALLTALGLSPLTAAKVFAVLVSGANVAMFSLTIRLLGLPRFAVALFSILFAATASFIFWSAVVESHPYSSFTILVALFMMLRVNTAHWGWWVLVNVLTLGFLLTNWVFALVAMAVRLKLKPFVAIGMGSFFIVTALAVVQNTSFEKAALFFNPETLIREHHHTQPDMASQGVMEEGWKPSANLRNIYVTTVVAMPAEVTHGYKRLVTTNQHSELPDGEISPVIAVIAWLILLGMGFWGATRQKELRPAVIGAAVLLAIQTVLFTVYGPVTFLYNPNWMPLLILFASMAWFAPYRGVALAMAGIVIVFAGINNERRLQETVAIADCLSEIDHIMELHTYETLRLGNAPYLESPSELYTDDVLQCKSITAS